MQKQMTSNNNKIYQKPSCKNIFLKKKKNIIIMFGLNIIYMLLYISNKEFELASSSPYYT